MEHEPQSNFAGKDQWIHLVYPKQKDSGFIGSEDKDTIDYEYVGLLAKIISRKEIRVVEDNGFTKQAPIEL